MYSSEKNPGINWKDLIIKAIFLVAFLLLLVWLFPSVPNMKPFYSNVFRENIKYMQDAAESYYTTEKLPKNIGDTAEMTLQEMINKNIILPFVDQDGNECDTLASYVQVRKNQNDYTLKVNLVCPTEKNYVDKTLGCYEYCETCKEELEYQFKKETTSNRTTYSCPEGGTLSNGQCYIYKTDSYKATETSTKGIYYCPEGGTLSGTKCYISKTDSYTASVSTGSYYCPYGGTLSGTKCYVSDSSSYAAQTNYTCLYGGTLSGSTCYQTLSGSSYTASIRYVCPDGTVQSNSTCRTTTSTPGSSYAASIRNYTCPNGKVQSSSTCTTTTTNAPITINATAKTTSTKVKYTTPKSGSAYTSLGTTTEYVCTSSANCPGYVTYYNYLYKTTTYSCPAGYNKNGTKCTKPGTSSTSTTTGKPNYYCPSGGNLSGTRCYKSGTTSSSTATGRREYYCPSGGTLSGTRCVTSGSTSSYKAEINRTCPNGGTLSGTRCVVDDSYNYNASKNSDTRYCPNGGTLSGTKCIIDSSYSYNASQTDGKTVLTCPNGGELKDKACYTTVLSKTYKAKATTQKVTAYSYKWSKEQTLAGWTPTGETRTVATNLAAKN